MLDYAFTVEKREYWTELVPRSRWHSLWKVPQISSTQPSGRLSYTQAPPVKARHPGAERCKRDVPLGVRPLPRDQHFSFTGISVGGFPFVSSQ